MNSRSFELCLHTQFITQPAYNKILSYETERRHSWAHHELPIWPAWGMARLHFHPPEEGIQQQDSHCHHKDVISKFPVMFFSILTLGGCNQNVLLNTALLRLETGTEVKQEKS